MANKKLIVIINKRKLCQASLEQLIDYVNVLDQNVPIRKAKLQFLLDRREEYFNDFMVANNQLLGLIELNELDLYLNEAINFVTKSEDLEYKLLDFITVESLQSAKGKHVANGREGNAAGFDPPNNQEVKVPKLDIPPYAGNQETLQVLKNGVSKPQSITTADNLAGGAPRFTLTNNQGVKFR